MKKVILGAALCTAAVALAGAANADGVNSDFLSGSTDALILGPTGIPTPDAAYISDAENLYLDPHGYDGTAASTLALTTPETYDFGSSVTQGENDIVNAVVAAAQRPVNWASFTVPQARNDGGYFAPLRDLAAGQETELYFALVPYHPDDQPDGTATDFKTRRVSGEAQDQAVLEG